MKSTKAKEVVTRQDFLAFLEFLGSDYRRFPETWENSTLAAFLEAIAAFAADLDGYRDQQGGPVDYESPSWSIFAQILAAGSVYE